MAERVRASTERLSRQLPDAGRQALEDFLAEASAQGERIVSATRLVLCGLALLRLLILVPHELAAGSTKYWTATTAILVGALVSVVWLLRHEPRVSPLRTPGETRRQKRVTPMPSATIANTNTTPNIAASRLCGKIA